MPLVETLPARSNQDGRRWPWFARALIVPVMMFANYIPYLLVATLVSRVVAPGSPGSQLIFFAVSLLVPATAVALVLLAMRKLDRRPRWQAGLFWNRGSLPAFLLGWAVSAAVLVPASLALNAAGLLRAPEIMIGDAWMIALEAFVTGVLVQGFPEELQWRGYLTQTLPFRSPWAVAALSAGVFGLMHLVSNGGQQSAGERLLYMGQACAFAFAAAALYRATGQLWAAVGVHGGMHLTNAITEQFGLGSGPALWAAESLGYLVVGALVMVWCDRARPASRRWPWARPAS